MTDRAGAPTFARVHHFSPTVTDVEASADWYQRVFGLDRMPVSFPHHGSEDKGYAVLLTDSRSGVAFGLHHHDVNEPTSPRWYREDVAVEVGGPRVLARRRGEDQPERVGAGQRV